MEHKIYAIVGPHAAGKRLLIKKLEDFGIHYIPSYTTREPIAGKHDQHFFIKVPKDDFFKLNLIEKVTYRGEYFGLKKDDIVQSLQQYPISMVLVETNGLKQLQRLLPRQLESIYIMVDYVSLIERMLKMNESNDEIKHNLEYAQNNNEFESWKISTYVVKNVHDSETALNQILALMGLIERKPLYAKQT
jgi:Guanylate kinase